MGCILESTHSNEVSATPLSADIYILKSDDDTLYGFAVSSFLAGVTTAAVVIATDIPDTATPTRQHPIFLDAAGNFYVFIGSNVVEKYNSSFVFESNINLARTPQLNGESLAMRKSDGKWFYCSQTSAYMADNDGANETLLASIEFARAGAYDNENDRYLAVERIDASTFDLRAFTDAPSSTLLIAGGPSAWGNEGFASFQNGLFVSRAGAQSTNVFIFDTVTRTYRTITTGTGAAAVMGIAISEDFLLIDDNSGALYRRGVGGDSLVQVHSLPPGDFVYGVFA